MLPWRPEMVAAARIPPSVEVGSHGVDAPQEGLALGLEGRTNRLLHNSRPRSLPVLGQLPERAEDEDDCDDHSDPPHAGRGEGRRNERHEEGEPQHRGNGARARRAWYVMS